MIEEPHFPRKQSAETSETFLAPAAIGQFSLGGYDEWMFVSAHSTKLLLLKKDLQCKAGRERVTSYHSEYPSPTIPILRIKEKKEKTARDKNGASN